VQFERFDKRKASASQNPFVTLQKRGPISLNQAAFEQLGRPEAVELLYARTERVIGLKPTSPKQPYAFPVRPQGSRGRTGNYTVAGQAFTKNYGIDTSIARRYAAEMQHDGTLLVDLKNSGVDATGPRAKKQADGSP
jgi:hypothetical protein